MLVKIKVSGLSEAEKTAREILDHVDAIRNLQMSAGYRGVDLEVEIEEGAASKTRGYASEG